MKLLKELKEKHKEMSSWRRHLHQFPEIAYEEEKTAEFVAGKLKGFGIEVHRGLGGTGVVGVIHGQDAGENNAQGKALAIGLRADMDALPMTEQTNLGVCFAASKCNACMWP